MATLGDIQDQAQKDLHGNRALSKASLAISATTDQFKTTATLTYTIAGEFLSKAVTDNLVFSDNTVYAANTTNYIVVCINAAGDVSTITPPVALVGDPDTTPTKIGAVPHDVVPFGVIKLVPGGSAFTSNTTALTAKATFAHCSVLPEDVSTLTYA